MQILKLLEGNRGENLNNLGSAMSLWADGRAYKTFSIFVQFLCKPKTKTTLRNKIYKIKKKIMDVCNLSRFFPPVSSGVFVSANYIILLSRSLK